MTDFSTILPWVGAIGAIAAMYFSFKGSRRTDEKDASTNATALTRIETKLENVWSAVDDIRLEMRSQQKQINDHETRLTRVETRLDMKGEL